MARQPKAPMSAEERYQFARSIMLLGQEAADATVELATLAADWQGGDQVHFDTLIDRSQTGVQSLNGLIVSNPDTRTDVAEALRRVVHPLRVAHDRLQAAKRQLTLSEIVFPLSDYPWPFIRAIDNLAKHQAAPPIVWAFDDVSVGVFSGDRSVRLGTLHTNVKSLRLPTRRTGADHVRLVDDIPRHFRGPEFAYAIEVRGPVLKVAATDEHPVEYDLRQVTLDCLPAALPLLKMAEG